MIKGALGLYEMGNRTDRYRESEISMTQTTLSKTAPITHRQPAHSKN